MEFCPCSPATDPGLQEKISEYGKYDGLHWIIPGFFTDDLDL